MSGLECRQRRETSARFPGGEEVQTTMTEASASDLCEMWSSDVYCRTQDEKTATGSPKLNASFPVDAR